MRCGCTRCLLPPEGNYLTGGLALSPDGTHARVRRHRRQRRTAAVDSAARLGARAAARRHQRRQRSVLVAVRCGDRVLRQRSVEAHPVGGGAATVICEAGVGAGGTWNADGMIVFQPHQQGRLMRVAAAGGRARAGRPRSTPTASETHHLYPSFLPDGRHFVFYVAGKQRGLYVGELGSTRAIVSVRSRSVAAAPEPRPRPVCTPTAGTCSTCAIAC